jgi:hypothetical protein
MTGLAGKKEGKTRLMNMVMQVKLVDMNETLTHSDEIISAPKG